VKPPPARHSPSHSQCDSRIASPRLPLAPSAAPWSAGSNSTPSTPYNNVALSASAALGVADRPIIRSRSGSDSTSRLLNKVSAYVGSAEDYLICDANERDDIVLRELSGSVTTPTANVLAAAAVVSALSTEEVEKEEGDIDLSPLPQSCSIPLPQKVPADDQVESRPSSLPLPLPLPLPSILSGENNFTTKNTGSKSMFDSLGEDLNTALKDLNKNTPALEIPYTSHGVKQTVENIEQTSSRIGSEKISVEKVTMQVNEELKDTGDRFEEMEYIHVDSASEPISSDPHSSLTSTEHCCVRVNHSPFYSPFYSTCTCTSTFSTATGPPIYTTA
jgi:hypothetical protein